ncbi:hypothetical protein [Nitrospirillum viridazoti]|uniref:hypothetical protein n=1 Tax=Nitrospirillum viridazoti TaxID=3144925 RepID=UPI0011A5197D|nr:hypothetical protein [Nitrospirillum amazonense]
MTATKVMHVARSLKASSVDVRETAAIARESEGNRERHFTPHSPKLGASFPERNVPVAFDLPLSTSSGNAGRRRGALKPGPHQTV